MFTQLILPALTLLLSCYVIFAQAAMPEACERHAIKSSLDGSERNLFVCIGHKGKAPLVVLLPAWSGGFPYAQEVIDEVAKREWNLVAPMHRGPLKTNDAIGTRYVVQDVIDAISYAENQGLVNSRHIYLLGTSGGWYTALMVAAYHPELIAGVSSWAAMTNLSDWYKETKNNGQQYYKQLESALGLPELESDLYRERSPVTYLSELKKIPLDINHGIGDGHHGSVYLSHALNFFNAIAAPTDKISPQLIEELMREKSTVRENHLDNSYGAKSVLFRRHSGLTRLTVFDGTHEMVPDAAMEWFSKQSK